MRIFLTGVSCVGKTTIGRKLAELLCVPFFDLDEEIEKSFGVSIERLQRRFRTLYSFREEAAKVLTDLMGREESLDSVIALPPSGLLGGYWRAIKKSTGITVALTDRPESILERITFFDIDSKPIQKTLTLDDKRWYLSEIRKDITYFGKTYGRAHLKVEVSGLNVDGAACKLQEAVETYQQGLVKQGNQFG